MSDFGAPLRIPGGASGATAAAGNTGRVVNPPPAVLQLGGETVTGTVAGRTPQGQLLVKGDFGQIAIATSARFPVGTPVALNFRPHVTGLFVTVVPRALGEGARPGGDANQIAQASGRAVGAAQAGDKAGARQPATDDATQALAGRRSSPPSSAVQISIQGQAQGSAGQGPQGGAQAPQRTALPPAPLGTAVPAAIDGQDAEGRLLVKGDFGRIAIDTATRLPSGTRVLLQFGNGQAGPVVTVFAEPPADAERPAPLRPLAFGALASEAQQGPPARPLSPTGTPAPLARVWPALTAFAEAFAEPQAASLGALLPPGFPPKVGPRLALSLLRFLQSTQGQGLLSWIGTTAPAVLTASHHGPSLIQLQEADDDLRWLAKDPPGDWRLVLLPLFGEGPPEALRFFLKKRGQSPEGEAPAPVRFLCDLSLSRLGALQLEGLFRDTRFDLVVRSRQPLASALRDELVGVFAAASEAGGLTGGLRFHTGEDWLPLPVPHPDGRQDSLSV